MIEKLTKKQIELQSVVRDEWIDIALHQKNFDKEELEAGVKWLYYASDLKEPKVVFVDGSKDFARKFRVSVRDSVGASVRDSVGASVWDSVRASVWDSVRASVWASVWASVRDSVGASVWASVRASVRDSVGASVWDSVRDSVWASVGDSVRDSVGASVRDSVRDTSLCYDSDYSAWMDYWLKSGIYKPTDDKLSKYLGFLKAGAFYTLFFEKVAYVMRRPTIVKQDEQKRLHSTTSPALAFKDGTELYMLHGVQFEKSWWDKIVNDKMSAETVFAIDNLEHRRIAYEFMDKSKMKKLKDFTILDEATDEKGNPMKIVSFKAKQVNEPLKYYNCICPSTGREYYIGTDKNTCKEAKVALFGLKEAEFVDEW